MELLKRLAPNYWAGYYAVYVLMTALLAAVFRAHLRTWPEIEALFVAAAIFAVSAGVALLSAIIAEGVGYMVLLIPRRIKKLKDEGRAEGRAEGRSEGRAEGVQEGIVTGRAQGIETGRAQGIETGRAQGIETGRAQGIETGRAQGVQEARAEERGRVSALLARHASGEITMEQLHAILSDRYNGNGV